jgi:hypothetical protein
MMKHKKPDQKKRSRAIKSSSRTLFGVPTTIKNLLIAIALLFAFLGGFFQVYTWVDTTYARRGWVQQIQDKQEFKWECDVLTGMYARFAALDTLVRLAPDPKSVPEALTNEHTNLPNAIKLQEDKVKLLQQKVVK